MLSRALCFAYQIQILSLIRFVYLLEDQMFFRGRVTAECILDKGSSLSLSSYVSIFRQNVSMKHLWHVKFPLYFLNFFVEFCYLIGEKTKEYDRSRLVADGCIA